MTINRANRYAYVYYCGNWTPRSDVTAFTISQKRGLAEARRRWYARPRRRR